MTEFSPRAVFLAGLERAPGVGLPAPDATHALARSAKKRRSMGLRASFLKVNPKAQLPSPLPIRSMNGTSMRTRGTRTNDEDSP